MVELARKPENVRSLGLLALEAQTLSDLSQPLGRPAGNDRDPDTPPLA